MPFKLSITNVPPEVRSWEATCGSAMSPRLRVNEAWYYPYTAPAQTIHIYGYHNGGIQYSWRNIWATPEGYHVIFDCSTQTITKLPLTEPPPPVPESQFRNLQITSVSPNNISAGTYNPTPVTVNFSVEHYGKSKTVFGVVRITTTAGVVVAGSTFQYTFYEDTSWRLYNISHTLNMPASPAVGTYNVTVSDIDSLTFTMSNAINVGMVATQFQNLWLKSIVPTKVKNGQAVTIYWQFEHIGEAKTVEVYAAIGKEIATIFDEKLNGKVTVQLTNDTSWKVYSGQIAILVSGLSVGMYDAYFKINGILPRAMHPTVKSCLEVYEDITTPTTPIIENLQVVGVNPPKQEVNKPVKITCVFDHVGASYTGTLYAAIGKQGLFGFDEILNNQIRISVPQHTVKTRLTYEIEVVLSGIRAGVYDAYCKINGLFPKVSPTLRSCLEVIEPLKHKCPYCGREFSTYAELEAHIRAVHPTEPVPPTEPSPPSMPAWGWLALAALAVLGLAEDDKERKGDKKRGKSK